MEQHLKSLCRDLRQSIVVAVAVAAAVIAHPADAQSAPAGAQVIMVPQPPGNPTDNLARQLQPLLQRELNQPIVVENAAGAGGSIGVAKALRASPASPTLLLASQTETILTPFALKESPYKSEQLRPVALISRGAYALVARPDLPAGSLAELERLARDRGVGRPLAFGHIGNGSMQHLMAERWAAKTRTPLTMVPYKGVGPVLQDLMGGQLDLAFMPLAGQIGDLILSGKLKALAATSAAPSARFPKVQTFAQQDKNLADFQFETWAAAFVPKATPEPVAIRLHKALTNALNEREFRDFIASTGGELIAPMTPAQLEAFYLAETSRYQQMSRESDIKPE